MNIIQINSIDPKPLKRPPECVFHILIVATNYTSRCESELGREKDLVSFSCSSEPEENMIFAARSRYRL